MTIATFGNALRRAGWWKRMQRWLRIDQGTPTDDAAGAAISAGRRVEWIDHAKGICIIAVVTMYSTHHVHQIVQSSGWMQYFVDFAKPFRMPDFFLLSGLFVGRVLDRSWRRYIDSKVLHFIYFYAVWVTIRFAYTDLRAVVGPDRGALLADYLLLYVQPPDGPLWFIYILALFFIAARVVRKLPPLLVLACAAALQAADLHTGAILLDKFSQYFVFFYSGHLFAKTVFRVAGAASSRGWLTAAGVLAWMALNAFLVETGWAGLPGISLLLGYAGAFAIILLATLCMRVRWMDWLRYLGQNSIVVYLGFVVPLGILRLFVKNASTQIDAGTLAFVVTLVSIAGAVVLYWALRNTPLRFLYVRPRFASIGAEPAGRPFSRQSSPERP